MDKETALLVGLAHVCKYVYFGRICGALLESKTEIPLQRWS